MKLREAIATVHNALINVVEDSLGSDSSEAEQLDAAWLKICDHINDLDEQRAQHSQTLAAIYQAITNSSDQFKVTPNFRQFWGESENEYSSESANPGIEEVQRDQ